MRRVRRLIRGKKLVRAKHQKVETWEPFEPPYWIDNSNQPPSQIDYSSQPPVQVNALNTPPVKLDVYPRLWKISS